MGIIYEVKDGNWWKPVSREEYEHFQGCKRVRPAGIPSGFYFVTNLLLVHR